MHPRAWTYAARALSRPELEQHGVVVVEFGGAEITDGYALRRLLPWSQWLSVDREAHAGVDAVGDAATWGEPGSADVVIATELLEHAEDGAGICANARRLLRPGGVFVSTMAGPTRSVHGARGEPTLEPGEFYRNVTPALLGEWLSSAGFGGFDIDLTIDGLDLRCTAHVPS